MPKNRLLIIGTSGQLGQSIKNISGTYSSYDIKFSHREDLDLSDSNSITKFFQMNQFDIIINCAAYTAVDKAESEPELANQINHLAVKQLAEISNQQDAKLVHISTDYVFNGKQFRPYVETDNVEPKSVYGLTKLKGEQALLAIRPKNSIIIRTSWVYSEFGNNFVKTMVKLGAERDELNIIFDQIGTPTYANDLASAIMTIVNSNEFNKITFNSEIYHYSNEGVCSWFDFAKAILEESNIQCDISPIETKDYPTPAVRPHYSLLNKAKIKHSYNLSIPYWKNSLKNCLKVLKDEVK